MRSAVDRGSLKGSLRMLNSNSLANDGTSPQGAQSPLSAPSGAGQPRSFIRISSARP